MIRKAEFMFKGFGNEVIGEYPAFRYHTQLDPLVVNNTQEDVDAKAKGYDEITAGAMANKYLINWFWDIEDMSPRQLRCFALEEYGVELPETASQEVLIKSVLELGRWAPQNRERIVLMAHTINMNYDATLEEIKRMANGGAGTVIERDDRELTL